MVVGDEVLKAPVEIGAVRDIDRFISAVIAMVGLPWPNTVNTSPGR